MGHANAFAHSISAWKYQALFEHFVGSQEVLHSFEEMNILYPHYQDTLRWDYGYQVIFSCNH